MDSTLGYFPGRFKEQVALVVGAAQGIGRAIALRLGREGAHVFLADIDREMLDRTAREMSQEGLSVKRAVCDVRRKTQVDRTASQAASWQGRIDVLMYIAGVAKLVPFNQTDETHWDHTLDVNLKGAFLVARAVTPGMVKRRYGKLVFMSSTNSWDAEAGLAPYNASKAALFLLAKTLARELGPHGINSNAVGPGLVKTRLTAPILKDPAFMKKYESLIPLGRLGEPEDIAGPAAFLASRDAAYVNGIMLFVDGGQLA